jgi:hypothetical protein
MEDTGCGLSMFLPTTIQYHQMPHFAKQLKLGLIGAANETISAKMSIQDIENAFPNLRGSPWRISSEIDESYNCIAFAVYDKQQFWDPNIVGIPGYYWPPGVSRDDNLASWMAVYEIHGFRVCESSDSEAGFEKIAIYTDENRVPNHVARQLRDGAWTSKLGPDEDIEHPSLEGLTSDIYGAAKVFMRRPITN